MQETVLRKLNSHLLECQSRNPSYSLRALARRLEVPISALSEILNGQRKVTSKMGKKILVGLGTDPEEIDSVLLPDKAELPEKKTLNSDHFKVISDWHYFAIPSLTETKNFVSEPDWIAERLGISKKVASEALDRLYRLGYIKDNKTQPVHFKTPSDIASASGKKHTSQTLDLARDSLFNDPVELRDFSTVTLAVSKNQIPEAKKMLARFRKRFQENLEVGERDEVYKLSIQFFPLTKRGAK